MQCREGADWEETATGLVGYILVMIVIVQTVVQPIAHRYSQVRSAFVMIVAVLPTATRMGPTIDWTGLVSAWTVVVSFSAGSRMHR